jgi:hypothetical protein
MPEDSTSWIDHLLVERVFQTYERGFWFHKLFEGETVRSLRKWPPVDEHMDERLRSEPSKRRSKVRQNYDFGRVRYFVDRLLAGEELDPIHVDNVCAGGHIYPELVIDDGHHRLVAYRLVKRSTIPVYYSGRVDLLEYLKGDRPKKPE